MTTPMTFATVPSFADGHRQMTRRSVLRTAGMVATGLGFLALGVFDRTVPAGADGYSIAPNGNGLSSGPGTCATPCGPSTIYDDSCRTSGTWVGYHKNEINLQTGDGWTLRPNDSGGGGWDGWIWAVNSACGYCPTQAKARCHDGWKWDAGQKVDTSICRTWISCT